MRIAFIEPHLKCVGGIRRIVEVSNRLIKRGHTVDVYTPTGKSCDWITCNAKVCLISNMHKYSYDVAIFNLAEQYKLMNNIDATLKVFWVLAPEALYKDPKIPIDAVKSNFCLIANSNFTVGYIRQYVNYRKDIPIIPGGINKEHFRYDPGIRRAYDVLYYGSARPWKGAQIVHAMLARQTPIKLKAIKMEGRNTPQPEMYKLYNSARVYVSANVVEGFSFGQLEAMACGCAVVTTDDGGSRDYIKNRFNAVVTPRNPALLYMSVVNVLNDSALYRTIVKNGLATAAEPRFDWDQSTQQLEKFLLKQLKI